MISLPKKNTFYIEKWEIDPLHNTIRYGSEQFDIEPKAMQVLEHLARYAGQTVHRDALFEAFWPNQVVTEEALTRVISHLRHCFADLPKSPRYIVTIRKTGYRLIAKVTSGDYFTNHPVNADSPVTQPMSIKLINFITKIATFSVATLLIYLIFNQPSSNYSTKAKASYITNELGDETSPTLSPDGLSVAYIKFDWRNKTDENTKYLHHLYVKDIASNKIKLLPFPEGNPLHPIWSPDNINIAFAHEVDLGNSATQYGIYNSNTLTGDFKLLTKTSTHNHGVTWSPDAQYIVYPDGPDESPPKFLYRLNVHTGKRDLILPLGSKSHAIFSYPKYSPDGNRIAVIRTDQGAYDSIDLIDMRTYSVKSILDTELKISSIEWKDDLTLFAISGSAATSQLFELSVDSKQTTYIDLEDKDIEYISYSQEKRRLIYENLNRPYNIAYINFTKEGDFIQGTSYTKSNRQELEAIERPDGRYTAIISSRSGAFEIWLRSNLDQQSKRLTTLNAHSINGLDWSPDQSKLSFVATVNHKQALYWLDVMSNTLSSFSLDKSHYSLIGWQDNNVMLFSSNQNNQWQLWRYFIDIKKTELVSADALLQGRLSPDRNTLYFVKPEKPGIWKSDLNRANVALVAGSENTTVFKSWAATDKGIYYFTFKNIGKEKELHFLDFKTAKTKRAAWAWNVYLNRIYWSKNRLYYSLYEQRDSDVAMIDGL